MSQGLVDLVLQVHVLVCGDLGAIGSGYWIFGFFFFSLLRIYVGINGMEDSMK